MKRAIFAAVAFGGALFGQSPSLIPNSPAVAEGQSITIVSSAPVNWSLNGVGSLSNQTTTSATYTAPASVTPQNVMGACPVLPNDAVLNTRIDNLPVNTNSANWVANVGSAGIDFLTTWAGISLADNTTPTGVIKNYYGSNVVSNNFVLPTAPALVRENGDFRSHYDNNDHHQIAVRTTDCTFWEIYNTYVNDNNQASICQDGSFGCNAASSITYPWSNYAVLGGTDAAGFPLAALTLHLDEIKTGAVNHALRFTSCLGCIQYTAAPFWPAAGVGGCSGNNVNGNPCSYSPPYGARFRLKSSFNISGYSQYAQVILRGLQQYGMFLADIGGEQEITISPDVSEDPTVMAAIGSINGIGMNNFEVVDESSLMVSSGSFQVCPLNQTCAGAQNTYEAPLDSAVITATPTAGGSAVSVPIAIQGVAIGLNSPSLFVQTGIYGYQIPSWVNGTSNQNVTWSLVSGPGSITSAGVYTPPQAIPVFYTGQGPLELGVKFRSDTNGYITGVRFYKNSSSTGIHTGSLWNSNGTLLASGTFTETASGWQNLTFATPVAITANTVYVASYHESDGDFYAGVNYFATAGVDNPPLHALPDGVSGPNGVYASGAGGIFPTSTYEASNYWVDVDFTTTVGGPATNIFSAANSPSATGNSAVLKATSAADANAVAHEYVTLLPPGYNPPGSIRIDVGNPSGITDGNGNSWLGDQGYEAGGYVQSPGDYPPWRDATNPEIGVYESTAYADTDPVWHFIVPNGNYQVRFMMGQPYGGTSFATTTMNRFAAGRMHLEAQGQIEAHNFDHGQNQPPGYKQIIGTPSDAYIPARVTNNTLEVAARGVFYQSDTLAFGTNCSGCMAAELGGIEIIPDITTPAHWAIDTQQQTTMAPAPTVWQLQTSTAGDSFELGTMFHSTISGYIAGLRFYKNAGDTGTHTGSLWDNQGNLLATGTFSGETSSGWQTLTFTTPVAIVANMQYVVSYHTNSGILYYGVGLFGVPVGPSQGIAGDSWFVNGNLVGYAGIWAVSSGGSYPSTVVSTAYAVDPLFSTASNGSNPSSLFPSNSLPGQQLQLYLVDWYTGLSDVQWSIVSGPGSIVVGTDIDGLPCAFYTAPSTQPEAGTAVVIQAQSASNPSIAGTATLYLAGSGYALK